MHGSDDVSSGQPPIKGSPLQDQSPAELDRLIKHYRRLLQSHRWAVRLGNAEMVQHALTAIEDIQVLLRDLLPLAAADQRVKIEAILEDERQRSPGASAD